jgi:hypothetical protein
MKNYLCQLLNVHGTGSVKQTEMHTAEPFVPEPSASEVEATTGNLKRYKPPGAAQIPAELIQAGWETLRSEIHKLIKLICNKEELPHHTGKSKLQYLFTKRVIKLTVVTIKAYHCCQLHTKFYQTFFSSVVLYGCETLSLTSTEEHRLRVFVYRVLRRVFGSRRLK